MPTRQELLASIAATTADYRAGELDAPSPEHVDHWVKQFSEDAQLPLLRELDHVLRESYLSRAKVLEFLDEVAGTEKLVGTKPKAFWRSATLLDCQINGESQTDMLRLFEEVLRARYGIGLGDCVGTSTDFVYLDDAIFTGGRAAADLERWIESSAPTSATIHVVVMACHTLGEYFLDQRIQEMATATGKKLKTKIWRAQTVETRKARKNSSGVLWPVELPDDGAVTAYAAEQKYPWEARTPNGKLWPFSSEEGRQLLERELLSAGVRIRATTQNIKAVLRPLGLSPFGLGFGAMTVTYRNCPNNAPLAFWWGNADGDGPAHFDNWYPLFPRKGYGDD